MAFDYFFVDLFWRCLCRRLRVGYRFLGGCLTRDKWVLRQNGQSEFSKIAKFNRRCLHKVITPQSSRHIAPNEAASSKEISLHSHSNREAMKGVFIVCIVFMAFYAMTPFSVEAAQQCVTCSSSGCYASNPSTKSCQRKCFTMLLRRKSRDQKPFMIKGCTSDQVFSRRRCQPRPQGFSLKWVGPHPFFKGKALGTRLRRCDNECYDEKKKFGGTNYHMCVHCCTGDNCNSDSSGSAGFQMKSGIILTFASTTLAVVKYL